MPYRARVTKKNCTRRITMRGYSLHAARLMLVIITCALCVSASLAQAQNDPAARPECGETEREKVAQARQASLTSAERMAWREIQERIDRMSHGEEAKDLDAAMHFMADDYTLYTLPDKDSPKGKVINRQQIAVYKKQNLDSLYSTSPETHTNIESLLIKGNLTTIIIHQYYVRVIRGGEDSTP